MKILRVTCYVFVLLLFLVALAFSASASTARAAPATVAKFKFHGLSAFANFDSTSGCIETFVFVDGSQNTSNGQTFSDADVFIEQTNICTNTLLLEAFGSTLSPDFQIRNLDSASLSAAISVTDNVSNTTFNVSVSMTWTGSGGVSTESGTFHQHFTGGFTENDHFIGQFRNATASGTVSDGTTNFTPSPSVSAQIGNFTSAVVVITQP
jgi:hypothetical protein